MNFTWYKLFNLDEFLALDLVSKTYQVVLEGIGQKDILVTRGNNVSVIYEDVFMPVLFQEANPFTRQGDSATYAVYKDANNDVHIGIEATG